MTAYHLRRFTEEGIAAFDEALRAIRDNTRQHLPDDLVMNDALAPILDPDIYVEQKNYTDKLTIAKDLHRVLAQVDLPNKFYDYRLWAWLAAFLFDTICPPRNDGTRKVGERYRYIPEHPLYWRTYYRHLLALPVRIYDEYRDMPLIIYSAEPHQMGAVIENLASRQELIMNRGIMEAATLLYWNPDTGTTKTRFDNKAHPGSMRRFVILMQQLDLTYDLHSMRGQDIVSLLPREFNAWIDRDSLT